MVAADSKEHDYGMKILTACVVSIILTAPIGAIMITLLGPMLLTQSTYPVETEKLRKSQRDNNIGEDDEI